MSNERKDSLREVFKMMWQFIRKNGYSRSEALKCAWANIKLKSAMKQRIVKFYFQKVDGTIREAYGTLKSSLMPQTQGSGRKHNETTQTYYDKEKAEYRCFKKANLVRIV